MYYLFKRELKRKVLPGFFYSFIFVFFALSLIYGYTLIDGLASRGQRPPGLGSGLSLRDTLPGDIHAPALIWVGWSLVRGHSCHLEASFHGQSGNPPPPPRPRRLRAPFPASQGGAVSRVTE